MFKLLRRVSSSLYKRPDRPWSEDGIFIYILPCITSLNAHSAATSSAPTIGRKRRVDDDEDDEVEQNAMDARKKGVTGVPFTIINGRWAVSGGQSSEVYAQVRARCLCHLS